MATNCEIGRFNCWFHWCGLCPEIAWSRLDYVGQMTPRYGKYHIFPESIHEAILRDTKFEIVARVIDGKFMEEKNNGI